MARSNTKFDFASEIIGWQKTSGRHDLPWQNTRDPYRIWVSESMLQQTQVSTVIPYFERFMARFPDVVALSNADEQDVLALWSGLGYYARGRNLHRAARRIRDECAGVFPRSFDEVMRLPGIGRSTAGAICVFAFGHIHPILDGNVKRVLARFFGVHGFPGERRVEHQMWALCATLLPRTDIEPYTQGLMDLGARVCVRTRPICNACPLCEHCVAKREQLVSRLPTPKPRKPVPHRRTRMLVFWDGQEVLLERRPSSGIWGGMWCFPESAELSREEDASVLARYGVERADCLKLDAIEHGFTHFKLTIEPYLLKVTRRTLRASEAGTLWLSLEDARQAALPAPVRAILHDLVNDPVNDLGQRRL